MKTVSGLVDLTDSTPNVVVGRFTDLDEKKLRGGYYTSSDVADWLCSWAIRSPNERVLEPSCGDGAFLVAATLRFRALGLPRSMVAERLNGVELQEAEAARARTRLQVLIGSHARDVVETSDFFKWWQSSAPRRFDVVIGNPPFIRYQSFPEPNRGRAMEIMRELALSPNRLTNIWVPFVAAAVRSLRPGGRLAMVLPAELLQVSYAAQLRSFLIDHFARVDIISCNELFFQKAEQEVVLLLADGALDRPTENNRCRVSMTEAHTLAEIVNRLPSVVLAETQPKTVRHDHEKWLKYFLAEREIGFMRELRASSVTTNMSTHASINVGVVTGKNEFFVLSKDQVAAHGLEEYVAPLISRSVQLKGAIINSHELDNLADSGDRVYLLHFQSTKHRQPSIALARYIRSGELKAIDAGYKCSIRSPWYAVPSVWAPDGFCFRQIYDFPRMVLNQACASSTDTIHRISCKSTSPETLIANTYTWLTAASAEIEGRSYGGGVLELEPTEAERLMMPSKIIAALPLAECDSLVRAGRLNDALEENARVILIGRMGLSRGEAYMLRDIWAKMRDRRLARRRLARRAKATVADE